jgi:hypothetical protein
MHKLSLGRVYPNQPMFRIRIRLDPHQFGKPDPDPHQSKKQGPDPHQSQLLEAVGFKIDLQIANDAEESVSKQMLRIRIRMDPHQFGKPDPDPHQSKKQGPDPHQSQLLEAVGLKIDLQMAMDAHNGCAKGQNGALEGLFASL